jgi:hypothetical protein
MARVTSIHVNSSGRITLYLEGSNPLEDYYPAYHNVSQAQAEKLLAEKGKIHGCTIEGLNYRSPGEAMPSDHKTAKRLAKKWHVHLKDKVLGGGSSVGGKARHARRRAHWSYMVHGPETLREFPTKREAVKFGTRLAKKSRRKYKNPLQTIVEKVKTDRSGVHSQYAPGAGVVWTSQLFEAARDIRKLLK